MPWWTGIFRAALDPGVEDVTLAIGRPPLMRVHGRLVTLGGAPLTEAQTMTLVEAITPPLMLRRLHALGQAEFVHILSERVQFLVHCYEFRGRVGLILRRTPQPQPHLHAGEED
ncbi:MAG: hypothetical protein HUU25_08110 [Candidatus Sumerlaeia bacterium]|nr:hypothetical protein [Candidatus Sumerlaeia bacterium]